jgi:mRNA interferase MazF
MKNFDEWNQHKKNIDTILNTHLYYPKEGEVWVSKIGINVGVEQDGSNLDFSRPVLVVKKFNNQMYWVLPLSSKQKFLDYYYNFTDPYSRKVSVILAQLKLSSIRRFERRIYEIDKDLFEDIKNRLKLFL